MKASPAARVVAAGLPVAVLAAACQMRSAAEYFEGQRAQHERRRAEFAALAAKDPVVTEALAQGGDVILGIRPALVEGVLREVAARYLDRVALDLPLETQVHDAHALTVGTFLGKVNAGTWTLDVTIHRVRGRLRARPPRVATAPDNTLTVSLPVVLQEGHGSATVHFSWDSRSIASVVCKDFEVTKRLEGEVISREYPVTGAFRLSAGPETLRAEPQFPPREFRIGVDMTDRSWAEVRAAIQEQDDVTKCGLGLDPDKLLAKIRERLHEGFDVKLPRSLFRPVDFPAAVRQDVMIEDRRVDLAVQTHALRITPVAVWYGADVHTRLQPEGAAAGSPVPSPAR
ncbi:MAG TPA: hypothetical protein VGQ33_14065 [Vicinamibacteria bacterium]|nr:hypothetical protein [Vicinamibacteria bacterium]